ncbi:hypothetical protein A2307_03240 [Candidatus Peregrinibacteria bacterium RIFOXYB2_FULL_33_20]|nr:MAG: hypothetical protein A2307_03240 [Candidatus Peregrinibacteria bacterium RIFOXYB2_FULL_33_20]
MEQLTVRLPESPEQLLQKMQTFGRELVQKYLENNKGRDLSVDQLQAIVNAVNVETAKNIPLEKSRRRLSADTRRWEMAEVYVQKKDIIFLMLVINLNSGQIDLDCDLGLNDSECIKRVRRSEEYRKSKEKRQVEICSVDLSSRQKLAPLIPISQNEDKREKPEEVWRGIQSFAKKLVQQYLKQSPSGTLSLEQLTEIQSKVNQAIQARYPMTEFEQRKYEELCLKGKRYNESVGLYVEGDIILYLEMNDFGSFKMMECNLTENETGRAIIQIITAREANAAKRREEEGVPVSGQLAVKSPESFDEELRRTTHGRSLAQVQVGGDIGDPPVRMKFGDAFKLVGPHTGLLNVLIGERGLDRNDNIGLSVDLARIIFNGIVEKAFVINNWKELQAIGDAFNVKMMRDYGVNPPTAKMRAEGEIVAQQPCPGIGEVQVIQTGPQTFWAFKNRYIN